MRKNIFLPLLTVLLTSTFLASCKSKAERKKEKQEEVYISDSTKAQQFIDSISKKDAKVLLVLPNSSKNVFYTEENIIKYYNVETGKVTVVPYGDIIEEDVSEIFAGKKNITVLTWAGPDEYGLYYLNTKTMKFSKNLLPIFDNSIEVDVKTSKSNGTITYTEVPRISDESMEWLPLALLSWDGNRDDYPLGKSITLIFDFDGNFIKKTKKDYTVGDRKERKERENRMNGEEE